MSTNDDYELRALESLRFDGEPERQVVLATKEKLMKMHGNEIRRSAFARRITIAATFVVALGVGAIAGPRVLEWWEHLTVVTDDELPDGQRHVVVEDDAGNTVLDTTMEADEALFQIQPDDDGEGGMLLQVAPIDPPDDTKPAARGGEPEKGVIPH